MCEMILRCASLPLDSTQGIQEFSYKLVIHLGPTVKFLFRALNFLLLNIVIEREIDEQQWEPA